MFPNLLTKPSIRCAAAITIMPLALSASPAQERDAAAIDIGERLELLVDDYLVGSVTGVEFRLHEPVKQPRAKSPVIGGYMTILKDGDVYRAYYRDKRLGYEGPGGEGNPGEITCCAESRDGMEWTFPDWGVTNARSPQGKNVILAGQPPFSHNFSPFIDTRPGVEPQARYKALAGGHRGGVHAFKSADGLRWTKIQDAPVLTTPLESSTPYGPYAFDSQNVAFWSEAENGYVCLARTWRDGLRRISRATSPDFVHWSPLADTEANLPGEQLYTSQTHPYFRAPHLYIATPTRYTQGLLMGKPVEGSSGSTDIMLMTMRAGGASYQRTFREAFIRPGLDPKRWARKANYMALNVVPTGSEEMSIYHEQSGERYALRTDGFISMRAGAARGEWVTKPLSFAGNALFVNFSTAAAGALRVEIQDASGQALPGLRLEDCPAIAGDSIERRVEWRTHPNLGPASGIPVRLRFQMQECDLYSFRFRKETPVASEEKQKMEDPVIALSEPVTVALAPPGASGWGPYQFPGLTRLPDGVIQLSFHLEADTAEAYGLPPGRAVSWDEGKTWTLLPREKAGTGTALSWGSGALRLENGDWISAKQQRSLRLAALVLPAKPLCAIKGAYYDDRAVYRVEDLPVACAGGWMLYRQPAGQSQKIEETPRVNLSGEVRVAIPGEGVMPLPWFQQMVLAPDGALWGISHARRVVDGKYEERTPVLILRSTDLGKTWDLWSRILYVGDPSADEKWAQRAGLLEAGFNFMPDGSVLCLMRTTDGNGVGPMYWVRSTDNGRTWTRPAVFDSLGVWPQMLTLKNGVTLAAYGRPGLYIRATSDPAGLRWGDRVAVVEPGEFLRDTCSYAALLPLADQKALVAYSDFHLRDADGKVRKGIAVREVKVSLKAVTPHGPVK